MSDLNDFFAKKDRKKKKPGKTAKQGASEGSRGNDAGFDKGAGGASFGGGAPKHSKGDDGWIELEETTTATVNTGGRTIQEFKREADDKDANGDADSPSEKFSGWSKTEAPQGTLTAASALMHGPLDSAPLCFHLTASTLESVADCAFVCSQWPSTSLSLRA
jgi:hypothetical protein